MLAQLNSTLLCLKSSVPRSSVLYPSQLDLKLLHSVCSRYWVSAAYLFKKTKQNQVIAKKKSLLTHQKKNGLTLRIYEEN